MGGIGSGRHKGTVPRCPLKIPCGCGNLKTRYAAQCNTCQDRDLRKSIKRMCEMCGAEFWRTAKARHVNGNQRDYRRFCSKSCYGLARRLGLMTFQGIPLTERLQLLDWWADIMRVRQLLGVSKTWVKSVCR